MADASGEFRWLLNLFDIALVAVVIYHFLLLLKGVEMAIRLLLWLSVAYVVLVTARLTGLLTLGWILDSFFSVALLVIVIIFQHDIRRALVSLSRERLRRLSRQDGITELLNELTTAVHDLAHRRIGALIVIERGISLDNFLGVGTEIDAKVTSELITSIFLPYSPIHDGAVIIQHGKLTRAGCFLPLSQNPEIGKNLGTRHRAAIGLTEVADPVVIVVSEETGKVSLVANGRIQENVDESGFRKELRRHLTGRRLP